MEGIWLVFRLREGRHTAPVSFFMRSQENTAPLLLTSSAPRLGMSVGFPSTTVEMRVRFLITSAVLAAKLIIPGSSYALVHEMRLIPCGSERICPGRRYGSSPLTCPAHDLFPGELIMRVINVVS